MQPDDFDPDWYIDHVVVAQADGEAAGQTRWRLLADRLRCEPRIGQLALRQRFVVSTAQARAAGVDQTEVRRRVRHGEWSLPRRGVLAPWAEQKVTASAIRATAAVLVRRDHVISHRSAAVLHDLPLVSLPGVPPLTVELTNTCSYSARSLPSAAIRTANLPPGAISDWYGAPVTSPGRTVVDLARGQRGQGLVAADAALRLARATPDDLERAIADASGLPGIRAAREIVTLASPLSESALESLTRLFLADSGFPPPVLQYRITDPIDGWHARVDMCWRALRLVLEVDGKLKYTDRELWHERIRQERIERLGYRVRRVRWAEIVWRPSATAGRLAADFR